ncbi:MAG: glycosyltransferase 87 family protein [Acidobacteria bacterium]|nr:glycosyltransferase 87 family protein [Acidobacteriota bacterium]
MARALPLAAATWPLLACFGGLLALDRTGLRPAADAPWATALFLAVLLLAFAGLFRAMKRLEPSLAQAAGELPVAGLLVVAALLRLLAAPLSPSLSDDVHRYLWDGRVAASGANPYLLEPDHPDLAGLRNDLWQRTAHRDVATVYPPLSLSLFAAASLLPQPLLSYKLTLATVDLVACGMLLVLARRRTSVVAALAYVWNPLVVIEGAGMGHVDVLGASLAIACVYLVPVRSGAHSGSARSLAAGAAAALGVLVKLVPLAAIPLWWRRIKGHRQRGRLFALGGACLLLPGAAGVLVLTGGFPPGLVVYALRWEYNGPLYEPVWRLLDVLQLDHAAAGLVHAVRLVFGGEIEAPPWDTLYAHTYPQFLARALLLLGAIAAWLRLWRQRPGPVGAAFGAFGIVLLASPTLYPWYLIWILPWAALLGARWVLLLSATLPLAYLPAFAGVDYFPWVYSAVWLPPLLLYLVDRRRQMHAAKVSGSRTERR